jgi:diacylglycerol kinase (ATP)
MDSEFELDWDHSVVLDSVKMSKPSELIVIQRNPRSGTGRGRAELLKLYRELRELGYRVRMFSRRSSLDRFVATVSSDRKLRCVVAAGGDGTVTDLTNRHPGLAIAVLPLGTENLLAAYLGIRRDGRQLARLIHQGFVRTLDSAIANGQRFLLMLSVGVDAEIVATIDSARTGHISRFSYLWPTVRAFLAGQNQVYHATSDSGHSIMGTHVIVTNVPRYGFNLKFAPEASPEDGLLHVRAYHGSSGPQLWWHALRLKLGLRIHSQEISVMTTTRVVITADTKADQSRVSQADGDPGPRTPVSISIAPGTVRLICNPIIQK